MLHKKSVSRWIWLCVVLAELAAVIGAGLILKRKPPVEIVYSQDELLYNTKEPEELGLCDYYAAPDLYLAPGFYKVEVDCQYSDRQAVKAEIAYVDNDKYLPLGTISLPNLTAEFQVKHKNCPVRVVMQLNENAAAGDYVLCRGVRIVSLPVTVRNTLFKLTILILLADIFFFWMTNRERFAMREEQKTCIKVLVLLTVAASAPVMANYLVFGHDLTFHLTRIEGLKEELLNGNFPVKMQTYWLYGNGYPVSVFYGDLLLYIPAILRIFGISIQASYNFYILLVNAGTVCISYYCFSRMSNMRIGLICAAVFSMNIYRLANIWTRGAVGEYTALMFMPLVLYGMWCIYACPEDSEQFAGGWRPLTAGCTGIFLSHVLSTEMTAFFIILTALLLWKKTFRRQRLSVLCKAAFATLFLCLWFLIPFADYMCSGTYGVSDAVQNGYKAFRLEMHGTFPAQLLLPGYSVTGGSELVREGVTNNMPLTAGLASMLVLAAWCWFFAGGGSHGSRAESREANLAGGLSLLSLAMTLYFFPYTEIARWFPAIGGILNSLQFPWRFLAPAGVLLAWLLCILLRGGWMNRKTKTVFAGILLLIAFWQGISYMGKLLQEEAPIFAYQTDFLSSAAVINGEYLPVTESGEGALSYMEKNGNTPIYAKNAVSVSEWHREKGEFLMSLTNLTDQAQAVEIPILKYKGYRALTDTGDALPIQTGGGGRISVSVPAGYSGMIRVSFHEPWYWRLSELISLGTLLVFLWILFRRRTAGLHSFRKDKNLVVDA